MVLHHACSLVSRWRASGVCVVVMLTSLTKMSRQVLLNMSRPHSTVMCETPRPVTACTCRTSRSVCSLQRERESKGKDHKQPYRTQRSTVPSLPPWSSWLWQGSSSSSSCYGSGGPRT